MKERLKKIIVSAGKVFKPFRIIPEIKPVFFIYVVTGITVGQIGILFSLVKDIHAFNEALFNNLSSGNFYTYSIALLASSLAPLLIEYIAEDDVKFKVYKVISMVLIIFFLMLPMTFFFSSLSLTPIEVSQMDVTRRSVDLVQILFYIFSIILSIYVFCVSYLKYDPESYTDLDDSNVLKLKLSASKTSTDSKGNKV